MMARAKVNRWVAALSALVLGSVVAVQPALAQTRAERTDGRWQAWLGCWQATGATAHVPGDTTGPSVMCVIPTESMSAVDIATVQDGKIVRRERLDATGAHQPSTEGGCTGWKSAAWSSDAARVYVQSEYSCSNGLERRSNGMFAISPAGEWLDLRSIEAGGNKGVSVMRYTPVSVPAVLEDDLSPVLNGRSLAVSTARSAAAAQPNTAALADASHHVDASVVEAWLIARHEGFQLDAKRLTELADAGVPGRVIDAMVALSYPKKFAITSGRQGGTIQSAAPGERATAYTDGVTGATIPVVMDPYGYGFLYGLDYYSPYGYGYPYGGYGYPYGYGWYLGGGPVVIIKQPPSTGAAGHGKMVKGRGYTRPSQGNDNGNVGPEPSVRSNGVSSGSRGGSGSSAPPRTAKPRP
jgi:hypothetical protein